MKLEVGSVQFQNWFTLINSVLPLCPLEVHFRRRSSISISTTSKVRSSDWRAEFFSINRLYTRRVHCSGVSGHICFKRESRKDLCAPLISIFFFRFFEVAITSSFSRFISLPHSFNCFVIF